MDYDNRKYLNQASILRKTKYIKYAKVNKAGLTLCQKLVSKRDKFLHDYKFDLGEKTCHFDDGQFVAFISYWNGPKAQRQMGFLDVAGGCVNKPYSPVVLYNLRVQKEKIFYHKEFDEFTCSYKLLYCGPRTVLLEKLPPALKNFQGKNRKLEYNRIVEELHNSDSTSMEMNLKRSGSIPSVVDNHCCIYDCVWKMLKYNENYMDNAVSTEMIKNRKMDHTQFEDLRITSKKSKDERKTLQEIMQSHGYDFVHLRDDRNKKIVKKLLFQEVFDHRRIGMFVCNLCCAHGGVNHTVGIAKSSNGDRKAYDSNFAKAMNLSLESLNKCLQTAECDGFNMVVGLHKNR